MTSKLSDVVFEYTGNEIVPKDVVSVRIHPSVINIEDETFSGCKQLRKVEFNEGLQKIGYRAFHGCVVLQKIKIPSTVIKIGNWAFRGCTGMKEVALNEGLTEIGNRAFTSCNALQSISIPSSILEIKAETFARCIDLEEVVLNDGLKMISQCSFELCQSIESITLPSTVVKIGFGAFQYCNKLREVVLNEGLTSIKTKVFEQCTALKSITIPSTIAEIGTSSFEGCCKLKEVELHEGLWMIGDNAFKDCSLLESITIPSTVTRIGKMSFKNCISLSQVIMNGIIKQMPPIPFMKLEQDLFAGCSSLKRIRFPIISKRLEYIILTGHLEVENKVYEILHRGDIRHLLLWRGSELFVWTPTIGSASGVSSYWACIKQSIDQITKAVSYYERKEATILFELALWKAKIDQAGDTSSINRDACRIEVPGPVKDAILQYL